MKKFIGIMFRMLWFGFLDVLGFVIIKPLVLIYKGIVFIVTPIFSFFEGTVDSNRIELTDKSKAIKHARVLIDKDPSLNIKYGDPEEPGCSMLGIVLISIVCASLFAVMWTASAGFFNAAIIAGSIAFIAIVLMVTLVNEGEVPEFTMESAEDRIAKELMENNYKLVGNYEKLY